MHHHTHSSSQLPCEISVTINPQLGGKAVFKSFNSLPKISDLLNCGGNGSQTQVF